MKSCLNKIFLCIVFLNTCCFHLATQQFEFNDFGFEFPRPFSNRNSEPIQSNLKIGKWLPPGQELVFIRGGNNNDNTGLAIANNNMLQRTMTPFIPAATTPTPQILQCIQNCPTTSEYNPICASNRQLYGNEQKFNCARRCGADIQIVRRGSCQGLIQMQRG